jgi:hypothetical protein
MKLRNGCLTTLLCLALFAPAFSQATGSKAATPLATRKIVAKVNLTASEMIYADELAATVDELEKAAKGSKMGSKDKLNLLVQRIDYVLFKQFGDRESIKVTESDLSARIADLKSQAGASASDAAIQASLIAQGVYLDTKSYLREDLLFSRYVMTKKQNELKAAGKYEVSEFTQAYEDMKFNLRRPELLRFSMLFVNLQGKSDADKQKATAAMQSIADQLKVNPTRFDEFLIKGLVDQNAGYVTAPTGTIYKTQDSKKQSPAIYAAAFALKEGEISGLISDTSRLCIIRAGETLPEKQLELTDGIDTLPSAGAIGYLQSISPNATVLDLIAYDLRSSKSEAFSKKVRNEIFDDIRKKASIKVALASLSDFLAPPEIEALKAMKGQYNFTFE